MPLAAFHTKPQCLTVIYIKWSDSITYEIKWCNERL